MNRVIKVTKRDRKRVRLPPILKNLCFLSENVTAANQQLSMKVLLVRTAATGDPLLILMYIFVKSCRNLKRQLLKQRQSQWCSFQYCSTVCESILKTEQDNRTSHQRGIKRESIACEPKLYQPLLAPLRTGLILPPSSKYHWVIEEAIMYCWNEAVTPNIQ